MGLNEEDQESGSSDDRDSYYSWEVLNVPNEF